LVTDDTKKVTPEARRERVASALRVLATFPARSPAEASNKDVPIQGMVVYERPDGIYRTDIRSGKTIKLTNHGTYPRWSSDGTHVAFLREHQIARVTIDGADAEAIADVTEPHAINVHPDGRQVLFTDGKAIRSVDIQTRAIATLFEGPTFHELDISQDGSRLVATVSGFAGLEYEVRGYDLIDGHSRKIASGCSASISPDGHRVSSLGRDHKRLSLRDWKTSEAVHGVIAPSGLKFDNQFWSNHPDWIVSQSEGAHVDVYIHQISANWTIRVTDSGDCNRADLYVFEAR